MCSYPFYFLVTEKKVKSKNVGRVRFYIGAINFYSDLKGLISDVSFLFNIKIDKLLIGPNKGSWIAGLVFL